MTLHDTCMNWGDITDKSTALTLDWVVLLGIAPLH